MWMHMVKFFQLSYILEDVHKIFGKRTSILKEDRDSYRSFKNAMKVEIKQKQNMGDYIFLGSRKADEQHA